MNASGWKEVRAVVLFTVLLLQGCVGSMDLDGNALETFVLAGKEADGVPLTVYSRQGELSFAFGDVLEPDASGEYLRGRHQHSTRTDSIAWQDIFALSYDRRVELRDRAGRRYDWANGDWRVLFENGRAVALQSDLEPGERVPISELNILTLYGSSSLLLTALGAGLLLLLYVLIRGDSLFRT